MKLLKAFGIIEVIIALGIFVIVATVALSTVVGTYNVNRLGIENTEAKFYAQAGIESARSIKNQGWDTSFLSTDCSAGCGITFNGTSWAWSGSSNNDGKLSRVITVSPVQRDVNGNIVETGGINDPNTREVKSLVEWNFGPNRNNSVSLVTYFTNFRLAINGNWSDVSQVGTLNLPGNDNAVKVQIIGNHAYVVRTLGNSKFSVINITNPENPTLDSSLALNPSSPLNIFVQGSTAFLVGTQNTDEFEAIDISDPLSPSVNGKFNLQGNSDASGVYVDNDYAYVVKFGNGGNDEFFILNISNPSSISLSGSTDLSGNGREVVVSGNYAFVGSSDNSQEIQVINTSNKSSPSFISALNLPGNSDAITVAQYEDLLFVGQDSDFHIIDASDVQNLNLISTLATSGNINDISINLANEGSYVFLAKSNNDAEFQVVDVSNVNNPIIVDAIDVSGNDDFNGVAYGEDSDTSVIVGNSNNDEVLIIKGN